MRQAGARVRITAQLIRTGDGFHLWSKTFDRDLANVLAVQEEIARNVVEALKVKLLPGQGVAARVVRTYDPEAYSKYLLGKELFRSGSIPDAKRALKVNEEAVARDPRLAPAWAGIAWDLIWLESMAGEGNSPEMRARAFTAAERAIDLEPELPDGWLARGRDAAGARFDEDKRQKLVAAIYVGVTMLFFLVAMISCFFYSLDALYGDRRDRSILFWKSLPLSDVETVLSKAVTALVVIPLAAAAGALLGQLGVALAGTLKFGQRDDARAVGAAGGGAAFAFYAAVAFMLWYAPLVAYLLAWSAWAPRSPFLYAVVPPVVLSLIEKLVLGSDHVGRLVAERTFGAGSESIDFGDFDLGSSTGEEPSMDLADLADFGDLGMDSSLGGMDEVGTKLDLAKAYVDMGDAEGARGMLEEVMQEGRDDQKRQAKELLSQTA